MAKTKFQVTFPDGTIGTRTSETRIYSHAVIVRETQSFVTTRIQNEIDRTKAAIERFRGELVGIESVDEKRTKRIASWTRSVAKMEAELASVPAAGRWGVWSMNGQLDRALREQEKVRRYIGSPHCEIVEVQVAKVEVA